MGTARSQMALRPILVECDCLAMAKPEFYINRFSAGAFDNEGNILSLREFNVSIDLSLRMQAIPLILLLSSASTTTWQHWRPSARLTQRCERDHAADAHSNFFKTC